MHQKAFIAKKHNHTNTKWIYAEFAKYRASIIGWDKKQIDQAITKYIDQHAGHNRKKILREDSSTKMSVIDINEAIRISVLDILFSNDTDDNIAHKFSKLCKEFASEMEIQGTKKNENSIFQNKELEVQNVKTILE
ncbi:MAG: hypothetical protein HC892_14525 [Saprospiraceae bacterium]|nr:hypothetical protein [Saprospiraceae bacterium]